MCGIAGIVFPPGRPPDRDRVTAMTDRLVHRGPDGRGLVVEGSAALGHTRLAILDPARGAQPMAGGTSGVWITYNGEIYNSPALREEISRSRAFRTHSDTEVIVKGYEAWGDAVVERLEGMFAFAIWDGPRRRLLLARDRLGIKPLLYSDAPGGLAFASEMPSLLASGLVEDAVDPESLADFIDLGYVPGPHTIHAGARRLPPAHTAVFEDGVLRLRRYWRPPVGEAEAGEDSAGDDEQARQWKAAFDIAVDRHRLSDVPIGVFLSGGIDSSLVAASLAKSHAAAAPSFCLGFPGLAGDETPYARAVAERIGLPFHTVSATGPEIEREIPGILARSGEPFGDSSIVPTWLLSRFAAHEVKVVLSGDGGDELFAGYTRYQGERLAHLLSGVPGGALHRSAAAVRALAAAAPARAGRRAQRLARFMEEAALPFQDRYHSKSRLARERGAAALLGPGRALHAHRDPAGRARPSAAHATDDSPQGRARGIIAALVESQPSSNDPLSLPALLDLEFYLPNDMLHKVDVASMAHSLEVRVPFLDHRVVELSLRLPASLKLRGLTTKWLLRRLAGEILPPEVARRSKRGFEGPTAAWMRGPLGGLLESWSTDGGGAALDAQVAPARVRALLDEHRRGAADHGPLLFNVLALWAWRRGR